MTIASVTLTARILDDHLQAIGGLFRPGAKITLLVRNPDVPGDADLVMTNDTLPAAIAALERRRRVDEEETMP